jgi:type II secretion system protein G
MQQIMNRQKGFTLIELLVVIAIIGILATIVMGSLNAARMKARDAQRMSDLRQIKNALMLYYDDHGKYPQPTGGSFTGYMQSNTPADWSQLQAWLGSYMTKVPVDPLNTMQDTVNAWGDGDYIYIYAAGGGYDDYLLTAQFENHSNPARNSVVHYVEHTRTPESSPAWWSSYLFADHP